jgi:hypothetical protein
LKGFVGLQVHAAVGALLRDNGQDHQRAFLDGEGILGLLQPGQAPTVKSLLGLANKDKAHAATRAGDRALADAREIGERARGSGGAAPASERVAAAAAMQLPTDVATGAAAAAEARLAGIVATEKGFTKPDFVRADVSGELAGLAQHVALPGFAMPDKMYPNRLADPEGKLRPTEEGEGAQSVRSLSYGCQKKCERLRNENVEFRILAVHAAFSALPAPGRHAPQPA